jgi:hypothetical protein
MTIEFARHFYAQELLNANAIIYPQYSLAPKTKTTFSRALRHHYSFKKVTDLAAEGSGQYC